MRLRLIKKFADRIDGIDLTPYGIGDFLLLPRRMAALLIAEGWAVLAERRRIDRYSPMPLHA